jgi:hypothetical protein
MKSIKLGSPSKSLRSCDSKETVKLQHHTGLSEELQALTIRDVNEPRHALHTTTNTKVQQMALAAKVDEILKNRPGLSASRWATDGFDSSDT